MNAVACHGSTVVVDALGIRTCYSTKCPSANRTESEPLINVRHGLAAYWDGVFGDTERFVDFDTHTLSIVKFEIRRSNGQAYQAIRRRRDITIPDDELQQIRAVVDSIWASNRPIPTAQIGLDGWWSTGLFNGDATRSDDGMGTPGGAASDLARLLRAIETRQGVSMLSLDRHWYFLFSCYPFASQIHVGNPQPLAYSRERWSKRGHEPDVFPPAPVHFEQFRAENDQEYCGQWD